MNAMFLSRMSRSVGYRFYSNSFACFNTTPAVDKMYDILQEYRAKNYSRELSSRFVKELLKHTDENKDGNMEYSEFKQFLDNIGVGDQMNKEEIDDVLKYVGGEDALDGQISIANMQKVLIDDLKARKK
ncbi:unnamed protein product [Cylindrotheca closterium]|uniref:EF-hand domain-containing protein n=1 Tax=Cylindrotheca closterium TaxID=2856 RepID=A0AAD2CDU0_9STRA|nr:unnamed protein product [Cylindrotheca closterium]